MATESRNRGDVSPCILVLTFIVRGIEVVMVVVADTLVEVGLVHERVHGLPSDGIGPKAHGGCHAVHEHKACQSLLPIDNDL